MGQAELIGREALKLLPNDHTIMFSLANVLGKLQKYKASLHSINFIIFVVHFGDVIPPMILSVCHTTGLSHIILCCCVVVFFLFVCLDVYFVVFPQESEGFFLHALRINPNAASCHGNLGKACVSLLRAHIFTQLMRDPKRSQAKRIIVHVSTGNVVPPTCPELNALNKWN